MSRRVAIAHSKAYQTAMCQSPKFDDRYEMIMELISAYELSDKLIQLPVTLDIDPMTFTSFHSSDYLSALVKLDKLAANDEDPDEDLESYGFAYDCPGFPGVLQYATAAVAASLTAADALIDGKAEVAINWGGGWHHAHRFEAAGFCYLNDVTLSILHLMNHFPRILCVDLDLHHGDGIEEAFSGSPRVMTFSVHHRSMGFYPGGGAVDVVGSGRGQYSVINLPLAEGANDTCWSSLVLSALSQVRSHFQPDAVVVQCGADGLATDPLRCFNLTLDGYVSVVSALLDWHLPTLLLGGGGYNKADTAKLWTRLTALAVGERLDEDIPEHSHWKCYGPDFQMAVSPSPRADCNTEEAIQTLLGGVEEILIAYAEKNPKRDQENVSAPSRQTTRHFRKILADASVSCSRLASTSGQASNSDGDCTFNFPVSPSPPLGVQTETDIVMTEVSQELY